MRLCCRWNMMLALVALLILLRPDAATAQDPNSGGLPPLPELPIADGKRVALVIGNGSYNEGEAWRPLPNAARDALYVANRLRNPVNGAGRFEVMVLIDADYDRMKKAVEAFKSHAATADVALVYYAGHGFEYNLANYLVPVDAPSAISPLSLDRRHIKMADVMEASTALQLSLFFLDACRTTDALRNSGVNEDGHRASLFGAIDARGSGVIYSAGRGQSAYDAAPAGEQTSPFAKAVIRYLNYPGLEFEKFYKYIAHDVRNATADFRPDQFPAAATRMDFRFYMVPVPAALQEAQIQSGPQAAGPVAAAAPPQPPTPVPEIDWAGYEQCMRGEMIIEDLQIPRGTCGIHFGLEDDPMPQAGPVGFASGGGILITLPKLTPLDIAVEVIDRTDDALLVMDILEDYSLERLDALSEQDDPLAAYVLGTIYFEGITVRRDTDKASHYFEKSAASGHPAGQYGLGQFLERMIFEYNLPVEGGGRITGLYRASFEQGYVKAGVRLAELYAEGLIALPDDNPDENLDIWRTMAARGHAGSHFELLYRGIDGDANFAALQKLAADGDGEASLWLCRLDDGRQANAVRVDHCFTAALDGHEMAVVALATDILSGGDHGMTASDVAYWARQALGNPLLPDQWIPCLEGLANNGEVTSACDLKV